MIEFLSPFRCKVRQTAGFPYYPSGKKHSGVDYVPINKANEENWRIFAPCSGRISYHNNDVYGNYVIICTGSSADSLNILMAHFDRFCDRYEVIAEGQLIGYAGNTGNSTGRHLHTEVYYYNNGEKKLLSPDSFINFNGGVMYPMWKNGSTSERLYFCAEHALQQFNDVAHLVIPPRAEGECLKLHYIDDKPVYAVKVLLGCGTCTGFVKYKGGVM